MGDRGVPELGRGVISLDRARLCVGRRAHHVDMPKVRGAVHHVDALDVHIRIDETGEVLPCMPENMVWDSTLPADLIDALETWDEWETGQCGFTPYLWQSDRGVMPNLGVIYSTALSNDDGEDRPLFAVAPLMRAVHQLSVTANPNWLWEIEEVMGWATP